MILVDTSVWVDHLRVSDKVLIGLLDGGMVLAHPFVIVELALSNLSQRETVLSALSDLPQPSLPPTRRCCISSIATRCSGAAPDISTSTCSPPYG